jgi:hypothetical protein
MKNLCHPESQEAYQRYYSLNMTGLYSEARVNSSAEHDFNPLTWVHTVHAFPVYTHMLQRTSGWYIMSLSALTPQHSTTLPV